MSSNPCTDPRANGSGAPLPCSSNDNCDNVITQTDHKSGKLYSVASPIGNLGDISSRAMKILGDVDFIAAEDTRVTGKLLRHFGIKKQLVSYHEHNSRESGEKILSRILAGEDCALITDAGTPGISDPGENLIRICIDASVQIIGIPGPCAAVTALVLSGLPAGRFTFEGFLSTARKSRFARLDELKSEKRTMVFYEAPHKLVRTLDDMLSVFGDRRVSISRELTKIYEETLRCTLMDAASHYKANPPRGEFVIVIEGAQHNTASEISLKEAADTVRSYITMGMSMKDATGKVSGETGIPKNKLYRAAVNDQ